MLIRKALPVLVFLSASIATAQYEMKVAQGYTPKIGLMVSMLEDLKARITAEVKDLNQSEIDFEFDEKANSIGALVMHLVATEAYYQVETLKNRKWTDEEAESWGIGSNLGEDSRREFKEKPIQYYLNLWDDLRLKTLEGLKNKDDDWFASEIDEGINHHWVWYHVMEHQANHMGQIALVKNRLPD